MRVLLVDKRFPEDPDIERDVLGDAGAYVHYKSAEEIPDDAWRTADAIQTFRNSKAVNDLALAGKLENCRIIVRGGVGFDNLDLPALGAKGIAVCNVPDYGTTEVADHAMAMFLALRRGLPTYHDALRSDPAAGWRYQAAPCVERLRGRRFGIVGLGRIGSATARRARAFDMEVLFYDPHLPDGADLATGYTRMGSAEDLFAAADAVSLHTPLNDDTERMVNAALLARMRTGAVLVNTSRGAVVDLDAVYGALKDGPLGGAALDVLPVEPADADHPMIAAYMAREPWLDGRLILSPHAAFYSYEGNNDLRRKCVETIVDYLVNGRLRNCVNRDWLRAG